MRNGRNCPFGVADVGGFGKEVGSWPESICCWRARRRAQKLLAACFKFASQFCQEIASLRSKNPGLNFIARVAVFVM